MTGKKHERGQVAGIPTDAMARGRHVHIRDCVELYRSLALAIGAGVMVAGAALYYFGVQDPIPLEALEGNGDEIVVRTVGVR